MARFVVLLYCTIIWTMIQNYQGRVKVTKTKIKVNKTKPKLTWHYHNTKLCMISATYQRSAVGERSLCLKKQPWQGVPPQGEITAMQPGCLAGRAQRRLGSGCHTYGKKCLACSQITCNRKGMHEIPCTHLLFLGKWVLEKPPAVHVFIAWSAFHAHCIALLLRWFSENRLELGKFFAHLWLRPLPPLEPVTNYH